jgi:hypothetical protein
VKAKSLLDNHLRRIGKTFVTLTEAAQGEKSGRLRDNPDVLLAGIRCPIAVWPWWQPRPPEPYSASPEGENRGEAYGYHDLKALSSLDSREPKSVSRFTGRRFPAPSITDPIADGGTKIQRMGFIPHRKVIGLPDL